MERPLFLPQYVSAAPAIAPSPADLLSCIKMITVNAILIIIKITVKIIFKTATLFSSYGYKLTTLSSITHTRHIFNCFLFPLM